MVRDDFIVRRHVLTDRQLDAAVAAGASGRTARRLRGQRSDTVWMAYPARARLARDVTPAFLIIPMLRFLGARANTLAPKAVARPVLFARAPG